MVLIRGQFEFKTLQAKPADGQDDVKVKQIALRTNENIQTMIKDLFHSPPIYKASVTLSFKVDFNFNFINSSTRILLIFMKFSLHQERSKSDSGAAKVGEKRKPITFYSASEGTGAKQGKTGAAFFSGRCYICFLLSHELAIFIW